MKMRAFDSTYQLELTSIEFKWSRSELNAKHQTFPYAKITGIFRDKLKCYVVATTGSVSFPHEPENGEYVRFVDELLQWVAFSHGDPHGHDHR